MMLTTAVLNKQNATWIAGALLCFSLIALLLSSCRPQKGKTGIFERLDEKYTNVGFSNTLIESDSLNILDYLYFYNGAGVAAADFNNDGLEDIYFVSNQSENALYLNKGGLQFEDITRKAGVAGTGNWKTGVTVVDINSDGYMDIYVCAVSGYKNLKGRNQLYINNGDLTFTEEAAKWGVDFEGLSTQAAFFDYDKDNDLDLFLLTHSVHSTDTYGDARQRLKYSYTAGDHLLRNEGNHFVNVTRGSGIYAAPIGYGLGVGIGDLNNDGWDDIYVSNDFFEQDYYYVNQQNGTFKEKLKDAFGHVSLFSMGNAISDINQDGSLDVITTDMLPEDMKALKSSINDEPLDIYNLEINSGYYYQYSKNTLQLNVAHGQKFIDIGLYSGIAATDWTWSPLAQDFDMDGFKDIFFSNGIKKRLTDLDYLKYLGDPYVARTANDRTFDKEKINMMPDGRAHNYLYRGDSLLKFSDVSSENDMKELSSSSGAVAADLDNDGDLELITNNIDQAAFIYKNTTIESDKKKPFFVDYTVKYQKGNLNGLGTKFFLKSKNKVDHQEMQSTSGFLSNQGKRLLFTFESSDQPLELLIVWPDNSYQVLNHFNLNSRQLVEYKKEHVSVSTNVRAVIEAFLEDRKQFDSKIVEAKLLAEVKVNETPDFNYYSLLPHTYLNHTPAVATGDINNDGWDDIYVGGIAGQEKYLLVANRKGNYDKITVPAFNEFKAYSDSEAQWCDLDYDGNLDLLVLTANHPFAERKDLLQPRLFLNRGGFRFEKADLPAISSQTARICLTDFNGDGLQDILLTGGISFRDYSRSTASYLLINKRYGNFEAAGTNVLGDLARVNHIKNVTCFDLNNDQKEDLIVAAEWQPISIFLNDGKRYARWRSSLLDTLKGWWQGVTIADINNDGKADLVAGNWGINNKFNVSLNRPMHGFNSDLDNDGKKDFILSYNFQDSYYPFRPKSDLEQELPYLKKEWLGYLKMADKTTDEIFKDKLDKTSMLSVNTFKSVFINDILNADEISELPVFLQQAPLLSVTHLANEWVINGNFSGVIPYEGRYDAMGLMSIQYYPTSNSFSLPRYWVNPDVNFQHIEYLKVIQQGKDTNCLVVTYDGKVIVLSEQRNKKELYAKG